MKTSQERRGVGIVCILEKVRRVYVCNISEIWRLVKMEKWCLRSFYMGSWNEWGLSCLTASGENPSVGSALHRWMYETARRLEHLIALYETWSISGKSEVREISPPTRVNWRIMWSYVVEVKTLFFHFYEREKSKFWGAIVRIKPQVGILGLGPYLVMWIRPRRSNWLERPQNGGSRNGRLEG